MIDFYVEQRSDYGIGNFINCTPTIKKLFDNHGQKIPVYFQLDVVRDMFLNCPFIQSITEEETQGKKKLFSSSMVNQDIPDHVFVYKSIIGGFKNIEDIPHTYVDALPNPEGYDDYIVVARGGVNNKWVDDKVPSEEVYMDLIDKFRKEMPASTKIVFIGSDADKERLSFFHNRFENMEVVMNDIKKSLSLINNCRFMITNDTGVYHAASALNKHTFVIWKNTNFSKNKSPGKNCFFARRAEWESGFEFWLEAQKNRTD